MSMSILLIVLLAIGLLVGAFTVLRRSRVIVPEDHAAVVVDHRGFVKRTLPAGVHHLLPGRERIEFTFKTKMDYCQATVETLPTADGIPLRITWSGLYYRDPSLITDQASQRLRSLVNAERKVQRLINITLGRLVGAYSMTELFKPPIRDRIERQLTETVANNLKPSGLVLHSISLEKIELPPEVASALNQAKAIEALDAALRQSDIATREIVAGVYRLDELLAWEHHLLPHSRHALTAGQVPLKLHTSAN